MVDTVLITGIGGSIGCHVFAHVMETTSWNVVGIDSFRHAGKTDRLSEIVRGNSGWMQRTRIITHDLIAPISDIMVRRIGPVQAIINLASMSDVFDSIENPVPFVKNNVDIVLNILEYARKMSDLQIFLQVSTDEVYGPTDGTFLHKEWDPIVPSNPYSASKVAQEAIAISYWRTYKVPLVIVNLMNNFGEMQSPKKFPALVQRKITNDEPVTVHGTKFTTGSRFYIHSRNTADAFLYIINNIPPYYHMEGMMDKPARFNIPGDQQIANDTLAYMIGDALGKQPDIKYEDFSVTRPGHDRHYGLDGAKLKSAGWTSPVPFKDRLEQTVKWQQEHPEWLAPKS